MERELVKIHDYKDIGEVKIDNSVVAVIAAIATLEIDGVKGMAGTATEDFVEKISKKNLKKGVKVITNGNIVNITISVIVEMTANVIELTDKITDKVTSTIETMTGLEVGELNINIEGVELDK